MISSVIPSAKYSFSGSALMLANGSTTMESVTALSRGAGAVAAASALTGARSRYPRFEIVSMMCGLRASSSKARRNSAVLRQTQQYSHYLGLEANGPAFGRYAVEGRIDDPAPHFEALLHELPRAGYRAGKYMA